MKFSITTIIAMTATMVSAAPAPAPVPDSSLEAIFKRQTTCAAAHESCVAPESLHIITDAIGTLPPLVAALLGPVSTITSQVTCCAGTTCTGPTAPLPGILAPIASLLGGLPVASCAEV